MFAGNSCMTSEQEDLAPQVPAIQSEEVSEIMGLMEEVDLIVVSVMQEDIAQQRLLPFFNEESCPGTTFTRNDKFGHITIDYGNSCVSERGIEKKGTLTINYSGEFLSKGTLLTIGFENFFLNGNQMEGTSTLENLGYQASTKSLSFSSKMEGLQLTSTNGKRYTVGHDYVRDLKLSTKETGFRIYLKGSGSMFTNSSDRTSFEIVKPVKYLQECMESGLSDPTEGSLQISSNASQKIMLNYESDGCNVFQ
jgi:hypothetical protein